MNKKIIVYTIIINIAGQKLSKYMFPECCYVLFSGVEETIVSLNINQSVIQ